MTIYTTLNEIREHSPCSSGWSKLLKSLGKTRADDEPLALEYILKSNGLDEALWALRAVKGQDKALRLFACQCARLVLPIYEKQYPEDGKPRKAIQAAEAFALGRIGKSELAKAYTNAADAARAAYFVARTARAAYAAYFVARATRAAYDDAYADATAYADAAYAYADACAAAEAAAEAAVYIDATAATYAARASSYAAGAATTREEIEKLFLGMCLE